MTANQWWIIAMVAWLGIALMLVTGCASRNSYDYGALAVGVGKQIQKPQPKP